MTINIYAKFSFTESRALKSAMLMLLLLLQKPKEHVQMSREVFTDMVHR